MTESQNKQHKNDKKGLVEDSTKPSFLIIGRIAKPHGVRGEVRVNIHTDLPERFTWLETVYLARHEDDPNPALVEVETARLHKNQALLKLAGHNGREQAELLRNRWVLVAAEDAIPLAEGEYFLYQLIGLAVYTDEAVHLGELVDVIETQANNVFVVRGEQGEVLLPDTDEVVQEIDFASGRLTVHIIPGLLPGKD